MNDMNMQNACNLWSVEVCIELSTYCDVVLCLLRVAHLWNNLHQVLATSIEHGKCVGVRTRPLVAMV